MGRCYDNNIRIREKACGVGGFQKTKERCTHELQALVFSSIFTREFVKAARYFIHAWQECVSPVGQTSYTRVENQRDLSSF